MSIGPTAVSSSADLDPRMEEGAIVKLHSLQSAAAEKHNGTNAQLGEFDQNTGRWQVKLRQGQKIINVRCANLSFVRALGNSGRLEDARWKFPYCNSLLLNLQENSLPVKLQDLSDARDWKGLMVLKDPAIQMARMEKGLNPTNAGAIYYNLALAHNFFRHFDEAIWFHEQDLGVAKCDEDVVWIAQAVRNIANVRVPSASQKRSVEDFDQMKQEIWIANFSASMIVEYATCLPDEGLYQCVIETLEPFLDFERNAGDRKQEGITCGALSGVRV